MLQVALVLGGTLIVRQARELTSEELPRKKSNAPLKIHAISEGQKIFAGSSSAWHLSVNECMFLILIVIIIITVIMMINS